MHTPLNILIIEDQVKDVAFLVNALHAAGFDPGWKWARTEAEFRAAIGGHLDLIFFDSSIGGFPVQRAIALLKDSNLNVPFVIISADGEEHALEIVKLGATDYVLKHQLDRLGTVVQRALQDGDGDRRKPKDD